MPTVPVLSSPLLPDSVTVCVCVRDLIKSLTIRNKLIFDALNYFSLYISSRFKGIFVFTAD